MIVMPAPPPSQRGGNHPPEQHRIHAMKVARDEPGTWILADVSCPTRGHTVLYKRNGFEAVQRKQANGFDVWIRLPAAPAPPPLLSPAPVDARQLVADTLTDIAVRLDTRQQTAEALFGMIYEHSSARGYLPDTRLTDRIIVALIAAAYADSEQTAALLDDLATASSRLDRHRATTGHDECCRGDCLCARWSSVRRVRCRDCEDGPGDLLWEAQSDLLHHLESLRSLPHLLRAAQDTT